MAAYPGEKNSKRTTAAEEYAKRESYRQAKLNRAYSIAELTIPSLMMRPGAKDSRIAEGPYTMAGARVLNSLASRMTLAMLPTNTAFVRFTFSEKFRRELEAKAQNDPSVRSAAEEQARAVERAVIQAVQERQIRPAFHELMLHWFGFGNVAYGMTQTGRLRVYPMDQFVQSRDAEGSLVRLIIKERLLYETLPAKALDAVGDAYRRRSGKDCEDSTELELYTSIKRNRSKRGDREDDVTYEVFQEVEGVVVPDSYSEAVTERKLRYRAARFMAAAGEHWARGFGELVLGGIKTAEGLSQLLTEGSAALAKIVWMVDETMCEGVDALADAPNGAYIPGRRGAVEPIIAGKGVDLSSPAQLLQSVVGELYQEGLVLQPRPSERTTATELTYQAQQIEVTRGGAYSICDAEIVRPILTWITDDLAARKEIPPTTLTVGWYKLLTGLDAIGRGQESQRFAEFAALVSQTFGPQAFAAFDLRIALQQLAATVGIDPNSYGLKSEETLAEEAQAAQNAAMMEKAIGPLAGKTGDIVRDQLSPNASEAE